jgi:hypothetical protein
MKNHAGFRPVRQTGIRNNLIYNNTTHLLDNENNERSYPPGKQYGRIQGISGAGAFIRTGTGKNESIFHLRQ